MWHRLCFNLDACKRSAISISLSLSLIHTHLTEMISVIFFGLIRGLLGGGGRWVGRGERGGTKFPQDLRICSSVASDQSEESRSH